MRILISVLALSVMICSLSVAAEPPSGAVNIDQKKTSARALLLQNKFQDAYDMYMQLLWERPNDDDVIVGLARSAMSVKKYYQAIIALEKLVDKYPADIKIRTELARVYVLVGDAASAKREFDYLKRRNVTLSDEDVQEAYEALLSQYSLFRYRGRVAVGGLYDSNANLGPVSDFIRENLRVPDLKHTPSFGAMTNISIDGSYDVGETAGWLLVGDAGVYDRYNFNSDLQANNNLLWLRGALGSRYLSSRYLIDFRAKEEMVYQSNDNTTDQTINSLGPELLFSYMLYPQLSLMTKAVGEYRFYNVSTDKDGLFWSLGEYARYFFSGLGHEVTVGGKISSMDTGDKRSNYFSWELSLRGGIRIADLHFDPFVSYREDKYRTPAIILDSEKRSDKQWKAGLAVAYDFNSRFGAELSYQYANNDSNSVMYVYEQHLMSMNVTWKF